MRLTQQQTVLSCSNKIHLLKAEPRTVYRGSFVTRRRGLAGDKGDASAGRKPIREEPGKPLRQAHAAQRKHRAQQGSCHLQCHRRHTALQPDAVETPQRSPHSEKNPYQLGNSALADLVSCVRMQPRQLSEGDIRDHVATGMSRHDGGTAPRFPQDPTQYQAPGAHDTLCPCILNLSGSRVLTAKKVRESSPDPSVPKPPARHVYTSLKAGICPGLGLFICRSGYQRPSPKPGSPLRTGVPGPRTAPGHGTHMRL